MVVQEPVVTLGPEAMKNNPYDSNIYKDYTNTGTRVSFTVWLPLLLHEGGPLLSKGVVQPFKEPSKKMERISKQHNEHRELQEEIKENENRHFSHPVVDTQPRSPETNLAKSYYKQSDPLVQTKRQDDTTTTRYYDDRYGVRQPTTGSYEQQTVTPRTENVNGKYKRSNFETDLHYDRTEVPSFKHAGGAKLDYDDRSHPTFTPTFNSTASTAGSKPRSDYTQTSVNPVTDEFRHEVKQTTRSGYPIKYTIVYDSNNMQYAEFGGKRYDLHSFKNHFGLW